MPCAASISSGENEGTLTKLRDGVEACRPCGPECCHSIVIATETETEITFRRDCPAKTEAIPTYNIDKDATAKSAIVKGGGARPPVDTFHHKQAFSAKMKELHVPDGAASAAINRLHNVTLRAQSQEIKDAAIDNLLAFIKGWNESKGGRLDPVALAKIDRYVKMSLGYSGSQWEGCIGDLSVKDIGGNTSTGGAESHFSSYLTLILNGAVECNIVEFVLETMLGVKENGTETQAPTYWSVFYRVFKESGGVITSTERRRRRMEATRLTILEAVPEELRPVIVEVPTAEGDLGGSRYVFVRRGVPPSVLSCASAKARNSARDGDLVAAASSLASLFDFDAAEKILVSEGTPSREGFTTYDRITGQCSNCPDWLKRGSTTDKCKHGHAVEIYDMNAAERQAEQSRFYSFLSNRERSSIPENRNRILYQGSVREVNEFLRLKGASSWRSTPVDCVSTSSSSSVQPSSYKVLTLQLRELLEHCTLLPGESGELVVTSFLQQDRSCKFFERIGLEYDDGRKVPGVRLYVHDTLVGPEGECAFELITTGEPSEPITLLVKTKRELRRKSVSEGAQEDRDSGARVPGNGRSHCRVAETTNLQAADAARPADVQMPRAGANKTVTHRRKRAGVPTSPNFTPAESAAAIAATGSKDKEKDAELPAKRARLQPETSQRADETG